MSKGEQLVHPELPFDMVERSDELTSDLRLKQFVAGATRDRTSKRLEACEAAFGDRYDDARRLAGSIKQHALDHLDHYLERFIANAEAAGAHVHVALDGEQANAICLDIANRHGSRLCVKSKSMVTEETRLVPALEAAGIETIETDLGEFIVQLDDDAPSHIVTPIIHKSRVEVAKAFEREIDAEYTEDPEALTMIARRYLREKFRAADLGISGGNFLVAETGSLVICTNEGNGGLSTACPGVHVAFVGIEKIIPRLDDLPVFLKLLARSGTGQPITVYTTIITGAQTISPPADGPAPELHIVLLDNGRSDVLAPETREMLRCIRCGACLNACPVYRHAGGGHAYGAVYSGPIGAVLTPHLLGREAYADLPQASSLCGACHSACPVDIDIPAQLVHLRRLHVRGGTTGWGARMLHRAWARCLRSPALYGLATRVQRTVLRSRSKADADGTRWVERGPGPLRGWTQARDLPAPAEERFRDWWRTRS